MCAQRGWISTAQGHPGPVRSASLAGMARLKAGLEVICQGRVKLSFRPADRILELQVVLSVGPQFFPLLDRNSRFGQCSETATGWLNLFRTSRHAQPCEESAKIKEAYG